MANTKIRQLNVKGTTYDLALPGDKVDKLIVNDATLDESTIQSKSALVVGSKAFAGQMGYYYKAVDYTTRRLWLSVTQPQVSSSGGVVSGIPIDEGVEASITVETTLAPEWEVGDKVSIVNNAKYHLCASVTEIGPGYVGIDNFDWLDDETGIIDATQGGEYDLDPDDYSICVVSKPTAGAVQLKHISLNVGSGNTTAGNETLAVGRANHVYGDYGVALGYGNDVGYCTIAGGANNSVNANYSLVTGGDNVVEGQPTSLIAGGKNHIITKGLGLTVGNGNEVNAEKCIVSGGGNIVNADLNAVSGDGNSTNGVANLIAGRRNSVSNARSNIVAGSDNQISSTSAGDSRGMNLVVGRYNEITNASASGATYYGMNVVAGESHIVSGTANVVTGVDHDISGSNNVVGGKLNALSSNYNLVVGRNNSLSSGNSPDASSKGYGMNIVAGYGQIVSGSVNIVAGRGNPSQNVSGNKNIVGGENNTVSGDENLVVGGSNTVSTARCLVGGKNNEVTKNHQLLIGEYLKGCKINSLAVGKYNVGGSNNLFEVGSGESDSSRKNVFSVSASQAKIGSYVSINTDPSTDSLINIYNGDDDYGTAVQPAIYISSRYSTPSYIKMEAEDASNGHCNQISLGNQTYFDTKSISLNATDGISLEDGVVFITKDDATRKITIGNSEQDPGSYSVGEIVSDVYDYGKLNFKDFTASVQSLQVEDSAAAKAFTFANVGSMMAYNAYAFVENKGDEDLWSLIQPTDPDYNVWFDIFTQATEGNLIIAYLKSHFDQDLRRVAQLNLYEVNDYVIYPPWSLPDDQDTAYNTPEAMFVCHYLSDSIWFWLTRQPDTSNIFFKYKRMSL